MLIEVQGLHHTYARGTPLERRALIDVDLQIPAGTRLGVVGRNGSGKSTLVQHLAGLLRPTRGRVLLDGVPAHAGSRAARARRRRVGIAFQYPEEQIFELTVHREVAFGPRNLGLEQPETAERVSWALRMVGLDPGDVLERCPLNLSGGEMRRVALAGVLAMQPDVLILDEPTVGLDPRGREQLLDRIGAWNTQDRLSLIVVSHDLAALARLTDRMVVICDGEVAVDGPTRRVLADVAQLRASGLTPPPAVDLLYQLRAAGWPLRVDGLLPQEAAEAIIAASAGTRTPDPAKREVA